MHSSDKNKISLNGNILNEPTADYEKGAMNLLREALSRSYTERFLMATRLYKIQAALNKAKITHKPCNPKK